MKLEHKIEKLQLMTGEALYSLKDAVEAANDEFQQEEGTAADVASHLEDIAVSLNDVIQTISLLGYFEQIQAGDEPLLRL